MIPLVGNQAELEDQRRVVDGTARETMDRLGVEVEYLVGTMIEVPRAAITADQVARTAQFFSFGTNDLTQLTFGFGRDDLDARLIAPYLDAGILEHNPFERLDVDFATLA